MGSVGRRFIVTSSSDHLCRSCIISAGRGCFVRLFRSKQACFAFSPFELLGELLVVAKLKRVFFLVFYPCVIRTVKFWLLRVV